VLAEEAEICFDEPLVIEKNWGVILIFSRTSLVWQIVLVVNHDLGKAITHFDDLILLNTELIASGSRTSVLSEENMNRAYRGQVLFTGKRLMLSAD